MLVRMPITDASDSADAMAGSFDVHVYYMVTVASATALAMCATEAVIHVATKAGGHDAQKSSISLPKVHQHAADSSLAVTEPPTFEWQDFHMIITGSNDDETNLGPCSPAFGR